MNVGMDLVPHLVEDLPLLRRLDISVDPFVRCEIGAIPIRFARRSAAVADRVLARWWSPSRRVELFGSTLLPGDIVRSAITVAFVNSAALSGALRTPGAGPRSMAAVETEQRIERFLAAHGPGPLVRAFAAHRMYEHARAVTFYHPMAEEDFVSGRLHMPGLAEYCRADLLWAAAGGWLETALVRGRVCVRLTERGQQPWRRMQEAWEAARAPDERERVRQRLQWLYHGSEYESLVDRMMPDHLEIRRQTYHEASIRPGTTVVDVGSGPGAGIVAPGGVADLVGPRGEVIAIDPQEHLLRMLVETAKRRGHHNVRALTGVGERIPLPSASVDTVISEGALQFMDLEAFSAEAYRVLRPGGMLSVAFPTAAYGGRSPYFRAAVARAAALAPADGASGAAPLLLSAGPVRQALERRGFIVRKAVEMSGDHDFSRPADLALFMLQTVRLMQRGLAHLPWGAQQERIQQLEAALAHVADGFSAAERRVNWEACQIIAAKPDNGASAKREPDALVPVSASVSVGLHDDIVYRGTEALPLPPAAARVLRALAQAHGPMSADNLMDRLAGLSRQTIYNSIAALRRGLPNSTRILLKRRVGYFVQSDTPNPSEEIR